MPTPPTAVPTVWVALASQVLETCDHPAALVLAKDIIECSEVVPPLRLVERRHPR